MKKILVSVFLICMVAVAFYSDAMVASGRAHAKKMVYGKRTPIKRIHKKAAVKKIRARGKPRPKKRALLAKRAVRPTKIRNNKRAVKKPVARARLAGLKTPVAPTPVPTPALAASPALVAKREAAAAASPAVVGAPLAAPAEAPSDFETFASWKKAVDALPRGLTTGLIRLGGTTYEGVACAHGLTEGVFNEALYDYCLGALSSPLAKPDTWLDGVAPRASFYDVDDETERSIYVQRAVLPVGSRLIIHGDLHGAVHGMVEALAEYIDVEHGFILKDPNTYLIFLGDYVDRGLYGYECIYTLLRLKNANPDRVFLVRGNHEDKELCIDYGFYLELHCKNVCHASKERVFNWYGLLPAALFVVCENRAAQLCHGGIEPSYNPARLLNAAASIQFQALPDLELKNGFMWSDFNVDPKEESRFIEGRGSSFSRKDTYEYFEKASREDGVILCTLIRAHQHSGAMMARILGTDGMNDDNHGIAKLWTTEKNTGTALWQNMVATLNVAQDTPYGRFKFNYDTYAILRLGERFRDWRLEVVRKTVPPTT